MTESFAQSLIHLEDYGRSILKPITTGYDCTTRSIIYDRNIEAIAAKEINPYGGE